MAFVVGSVIIGAGAALGGAALSAKGAKDAAKTAKAGSDAEIAYNRESRDIALGLAKPYRTAGYKALDKLGAMTGLLGEGESFSVNIGSGDTIPYLPDGYTIDPGGYDAEAGVMRAPVVSGSNTPSWMDARSSAYGGSQREDFAGRIKRGFAGRAYGGVLYNVNELGPESVYSKGSITRSASPKTMPPDPRGYVHPNIKGRAIGGTMVDPNSMGDSVYGAPSGVNKGGEFGWRDGIPSNKRNMSNPTIDMTADVFNSGTNNGAIYDQGGVPVPQENPYDFTTDPGYNFRFNEGMRALEASAAARGGLLSGGFGRKAIRYGQDYASNEFSNIYNRISNIAGLGQVSAGQGGVFAQNAGAQMGGAAGQGALSSAYGQMAGTNAWAGAINDIAKLPWDKVFK